MRHSLSLAIQAGPGQLIVWTAINGSEVTAAEPPHCLIELRNRVPIPTRLSDLANHGISVRVLGVDTVNPWTKAGVMIRDTSRPPRM